MKSFKLMCLLAVFLLSIMSPAQAVFKASDLKGHCEGSWTRTGSRDSESDMVNQAVCVSYIEGYRGGILAMFKKFELIKKKEKLEVEKKNKAKENINDKVAKEDLENKEGLELLFGCVPYRTLSRVNYSATRNMFSKYLSKHPELMDSLVEEVLTETLLDYFCKQEDVDEFSIEKETIKEKEGSLKVDKEISFD